MPGHFIGVFLQIFHGSRVQGQMDSQLGFVNPVAQFEHFLSFQVVVVAGCRQGTP
jgi:hypothetical protein